MQQMKRQGLWMEILIGGDGDVGDKDDADVEDEQTWVVDWWQLSIGGCGSVWKLLIGDQKTFIAFVSV